jgi:hypothetical protein
MEAAAVDIFTEEESIYLVNELLTWFYLNRTRSVITSMIPQLEKNQSYKKKTFLYI